MEEKVGHWRKDGGAATAKMTINAIQARISAYLSSTTSQSILFSFADTSVPSAMYLLR